MKIGLFILSLLLVFASCKPKEVLKELSYSEIALLQSQLPINLPKFSNGITFIPDSTIHYVNIFVPNDSTIQVGDSLFSIEDTLNNNLFISRYMQRGAKLDKELINFGNSLLKTNKSTIEVNLFCDSSIRMKPYKYARFILAQLEVPENRFLNLFGYGNSFVKFNYSKLIEPIYSCILTKEKSIFEILINSEDKLMIETNWDSKIEEVDSLIKLFYTNPRNSENYPAMNNFTLGYVIERLDYYKKLDSSNVKFIIDILKWQNIRDVINQIGNFKKLERYSFVFVESTDKATFNYYCKVVNKIQGAVNDLRNQLSQKAFNIPYDSLRANPKMKEQLKAVEFVYDTRINNKVTYPIPPPPKLPNHLID